ncbi:MAG: triose-phosphate isomerase [Oligoflexales bacterium]
MRIPVMAGNWKMNQSASDIHPYFDTLELSSQCEVMIAAPAVYLHNCILAARPKGCRILAQNSHHEDRGAYTGEISPTMLKDIEAYGSLVGHSERRQYFHESDEDVRRKTQALLNHDLYAIVCVGETLEERETGQTLQVIERQIHAVKDLCNHRMLIAYEPVWAIGTGKSATPDDVQNIHKAIRGFLGSLGAQTRILYGGSVKPENAASILKNPDVDGALVGGASLKASDFQKLINACLPQA